MEENKDQTQIPPQSAKKVIQPLNPEEVKAYIAQTNVQAPQQTSAASNTQIGTSPPTSPPTNDKPFEWKPNTPLSRRIRALRTYSIVLIIGSLFFMYMSRMLWNFARIGVMKNLAFIVYGILGLYLLIGVILLVTKSKLLVQVCLDLLIVLAFGLLALSLLRINVITILFSISMIVSVLSMKNLVKRAA